jgi:methanogenic corrinoid protein MtbC1
MFENFIKAIIDLDENMAIKLAKERIERGEDPIKILDDIKIAVDEIGRKYEAKEYFIADLVMAGEILKEISEILKPALTGKTIEKIGKIVIGTVEGDIHDIGKNIAITMLEGAGFEVIDLGVDVSSQKFVEAIKQHSPQL